MSFTLYKKINITLPNGVMRKAQLFPNGKIRWVTYVCGKQKCLTGKIINGVFQTDKTYDNVIMKRDRCNSPQTYEEFKFRNNEYRKKYIQKLIEKFGKIVQYNNENRVMNYHVNKHGYGFIHYDGDKLYGYNVGGQFILKDS